MIKKISKLYKVGRFSSINQEKVFQCNGSGQNSNIIFGFNGSGKTTLSNAISFFAESSFIDENEKKEIYDDIKNGDDAFVEIELQDGNKCKYPSSKCSKDKKIYIFNSNFVITHVFDGTRGNLKKFSNISGEIKNKEIDNINEQIHKLNTEKAKLENENKKFDEKLEEITKVKSLNFSRSLTDRNKRLTRLNLNNVLLPAENIEKVEARLAMLFADYDLSKKQTELNASLEEIRQLDFGSIILDFVNIDNLLSKNIQQLSKEVLEKKIKEIQHFFYDDQHKQGVEKWFRFGKDILEGINERGEKKCPICDTDISDKINSVLEDYYGYFDERYEEFVEELKGETENVSAKIVTLERYETNFGKLEHYKHNYEKLLSDFSLKRYDFAAAIIDLKELKKLLGLKNDNIQINLSKPKDIENNIIAVNSALIDFQELKDNILEILESKKLNTHIIEGQIRETYNEIITLEFNQSNQTGALVEYKNNQKRIAEIANIENPALKDKLFEELKKIKAESKSISKYLSKMGISNFSVDINEGNIDENIIIKYKNSTGTRNKLRNCLSEGEKTALAFAYFLSKFENEVNSEVKIKEAIVAIDDPISSLDDNRLYSTAHLIWRNFNDVKQLIVLSHNFLFLKFFNSFYAGKANCLFLDQDKIAELPNELKNFETPYFFMLQELINFRDGKVPYNKCSRYLPSYTRRVLETFLSFKFAKISSSKNKNYSPGIEDFDDNIDETNLEEGLKRDLIDRIKEIKNISDKFAHGNLQHIQENFYISETDLRILVQNTFFVIEAMDNLHKTCFMKAENQILFTQIKKAEDTKTMIVGTVNKEELRSGGEKEALEKVTV